MKLKSLIMKSPALERFMFRSGSII